MSKLESFASQLSDMQTVLMPRVENGKKVAKPSPVRKIVTVVGLKTTKARFLPVSHEGYSTDTYIDKVELLGTTRAEFIARKIKGIERRAHMSMFRELIEAESKEGWEKSFTKFFDKSCFIPDELCIACWNCSLFGGLDPGQKGKGGTFSRVRYFDTYSIESADFAVAMEGSEEGMAIGNTVLEDLSKKRGADSYHQYEYVKAGVSFPFITIIENPTLLDVAGYLRAVRLADEHGYGKYSANHGKFSTNFLAVSTGYPHFSVLDMLEWGIVDDTNTDKTKSETSCEKPGKELEGKLAGDAIKSNFKQEAPGVEFEVNVGQAVTLLGEEIRKLEGKLTAEFKNYYAMLKG